MATAIIASPSSWRGKRARQYLFPFPGGWDRDRGGPRHGEAVAVVGFDRHDKGFEVAYIRSYQPSAGHARQAYEWLKATHGRLTAVEVVDTGRAFHEHMLAIGLLAEFETGDGQRIRPQRPYPSTKELSMICTPTASIEAQTSLFTQHLCTRIFAHNGYGTTEALIAAITRATAIPENTEWRKRKAAFNEIAETAPMRDDGFLLKYEDVPAFLSTETTAFKNTLSAAASVATSPVSSLRLETIHLSADHKIGLSTITFTEGSLHDSTCDWGAEYPDAKTENVTLLLYGEDDRLLDRALIDGDTWRDIEQADPGEFYEAVFRNQSINQALQETIGHAPSI